MNWNKKLKIWKKENKVATFVLKLKNNIILTYRLNNARDSLEVLKNNGEEEQVFNEKEYWTWFLKKNEYENEALSFLVLTDKDEFLLPDNIVLAESNSAMDLDIQGIQTTLDSDFELKLLAFPEINNLKIQDVVVSSNNKKPKKCVAIKKKGIQEYFIEKMEEYRSR